MKISTLARWCCAISIVMFSLTACASHGSGPKTSRNAQNNSLTIRTPQNHKSQSNGTVISLKEITSAKFPAGVWQGTKLYSLTYWSRAVRVQGYLAVPPGSGSHPLLLRLHGGYFITQFLHTSKNLNYGFTLHDVEADPPVDGDINFYPNYAGYGLSQGVVGNPYDCYLDTMNGIKALSHVEGLHIKQDATYIIGGSVGGTVGMKVAENDPAVKAVALLSPDPGAAEFMSWLASQKQSNLDQQDLTDMTSFKTLEGTKLNSQWYQRNSFSYKNVHLPIIIVGGDGDPIFPPRLLKQMFQRLHRHDPKVQIQFVPGGHAPLDSKTFYVMTHFLYRYGLNV